MIYTSLSLLGVPAVAVRFHSQFTDEASRRQLFTFLLVVPLAGLSAFILLYLLFKPLYLEFYFDDSPLLVRYFSVFIPLTVGMAYLSVLEAYSRISLRIAVPSLIREVGRGCRTSLLDALWLRVISFDRMVSLTVVSYALAVGLMLYYLHRQGRLTAVSTSALCGIRPSGTCTATAGAGTAGRGQRGAAAAHREGTLPGFEGGLGNTAIFDVASRIALVIAIPRNSIAMISAPIIRQPASATTCGTSKPSTRNPR